MLSIVLRRGLMDAMVQKGVLSKVGRTGRGAYYILKGKQDINRTNRTNPGAAQTGHKQDKRDDPWKPSASAATRKPAKRK